MSNAPLIAFVDGRRVRVAPGATVLDAVRAASPDAARAVDEGARIVTDSRGLPIAADALVHGGAIFRLASARRRDLHPNGER